MGQGQRSAAQVVDTVITNVVLLDHWGIVKADVGIKNGRIASIGKAGNPDIQPDVDIVIGAATEAIAGEGLIMTAGAIDAHIHFICPQQVEDAMMSGVTTMIGGGTGPATGTNATTCTPGPWHIARMYQALEELPINFGLLGKGNASLPAPLEEQIRAGVIGLKLHEDWCAVGLRNIELIAEDGLVERAAVMGRRLLVGLEQLKELPQVGDVRGLGMMCGVELVEDKASKKPALGLGAKVAREALQRGLLIRIRGGGAEPAFGDTICVAPPLMTPAESLERITAILRDSIAAAAR